jgi:HAD superfamily hydrolase (TIGR01509 family)
MIEMVIFDLGQVLVRVDESPLIAALAQELRRSEGEVRQLLRALMPQVLDYEQGRYNAVEFYLRVLKHLGLDADRYPFSRYREDWCSLLQPMPEMEALFRETCAARTTCILSNTNDLHWVWTAQRFDILQRAAATLTSYQVGLYKPDPEIYRRGLERFGARDPQTAVFVDDKPENVEAARAVGMSHSFVHRGPDTTRRELQQLGVLPSRTG